SAPRRSASRAGFRTCPFSRAPLQNARNLKLHHIITNSRAAPVGERKKARRSLRRAFAMFTAFSDGLKPRLEGGAVHIEEGGLDAGGEGGVPVHGLKAQRLDRRAQQDDVRGLLVA